MSFDQGEAKILQMIEMIKKEAEDKAASIIEDVRHRVQKEKNKEFNIAYETLVDEINKKEINFKLEKKLEFSRNINSNRIEFQRHREALINSIKEDAELILMKRIVAYGYPKLLKGLIMEGLIKLIEKEVYIMCCKKDIETISEIIPDIEKEYEEYMKGNLGKTMKVNLKIIDNKFLEETELGGVKLYVTNFRVTYENTLKSRLNLVFSSSIPDIKKQIFHD